ncbi:MAG: CRTAC1 family protein [Pirellulales bacterium]
MKMYAWYICVVVIALTHRFMLADEPVSTIRFMDVTESSKIQFQYENGSSDQYFIVETVGAGVCLFDSDNDGLLDVYLVNGAALPGRTITPAPTDRIFLNRGGMQFRDVTNQSRLVETSYGLGVTSADYDNDGFADLYISNFGTKRLMHNNGDGTFTNVTFKAGVADGEKFGAGVTFLDIENDGDLDLFVGNYVIFDFERHRQLAPKSHPYPPGPKDFPAEKDSLFLNNGDGTFADVSRSSGIQNALGPSMGVVAADFDQDGDVDIFVGCDGAPNLYYQNDGLGNFTEEALLVGVAYDARGGANGSMGADVGDLDGDGRLDIVVTNYMDQLMELFRNSTLGFDDVSSQMKIGKSVKPHVNWGVSLADLDLDGDLDAFICNGHFLKHAKSIEPNTDYAVANCVMENLNNKLFRNAAQDAGTALNHVASSRGCAFDDLDNDGDIDGVILNCDTLSQVLENRRENKNHWIKLRLVGKDCNRSAVGAKVKTEIDGKVQYYEQINGRGYQSYFGSVLTIGLGSNQRIDKLEILWPGDPKPTLLLDVNVDQEHFVVQQ